jgi:alpha-1,6-mannosyltransferase
VLAGVVAAGAVAVKVTAVVVVPFVLLLLGRRWAAGVVGTLAGFVAVSLATGLDLGWVQALRGTGELAQWSSVPTAVGMTVGYLLRPFGLDAAGPIAAARVVGVVALAGVGVGLVFWAWRRRAGTQKIVLASGLALAATAILGPVFYPWYAIAPLAVLAASATERRHWLAVATVICTFLTLPNGLGVPVLTKAVGAFAVTAALIVLAIRTRRPARAA